ncbi:MAG: 23S rRNA (pseudouridine(1915)-N(3))-methyltransferase RlmH, partial [Firmicutes bacterium]|nr:23S rRNA (pseudouridine(1915)-N(3))-methyltransferase RlmH [Bacillota bacterium]
MEIIIICIGKLKERYWTEAIAEYSKRLSRFCSLRIEELKEEKLAENASAADEEFVKEAEGKRIL